jgi:RNA polymerase sigma-70 factor (ECF subfamily)
LVARCNLGDRRAWEEFYARYYGLISRAVRKHCRARPDGVEDLIQEVYLSLFKALKDYDPARPIEAYILEIARRVGISRFRKDTAQKRGGGNPCPVPIDTLDSAGRGESVAVASPWRDQERSLIEAEERGMLRRALAGISDACRGLLDLRYREMLAYKEIAERTGVREGALRVRVQRCLTALAKSYAGLDPEEEGKP